MKELDGVFIDGELGGMARFKGLTCLAPVMDRDAYVVQGNRRGVRKVRRALREWHQGALVRLFQGRNARAWVFGEGLVLTRETFLMALTVPQVLAKGGGAA
ncbi:hypothetical protein [Myxococcus sp. NMCA1]|uniref:hypothetical protein n=1 Tax=Myxococcus sp. NMCA1 TaxID=2996785 RepID=UPI002285B35F|nr:hypothetical protein [Myxococcus sp. NMCA1]WAM23832.1 hypothetical protein OZ403_25155 [Myxococcus sp. NMCA1]